MIVNNNEIDLNTSLEQSQLISVSTAIRNQRGRVTHAIVYHAASLIQLNR